MTTQTILAFVSIAGAIGSLLYLREIRKLNEKKDDESRNTPMVCRYCGAVWVIKHDGLWSEHPDNEKVRESMRAHRCATKCDACEGRGFVPVNAVEVER